MQLNLMILAMMTLILAACFQGATPIANGYSSVNLGGDRVITNAEGTIAVDHNVTGYAVLETTIIGYREPSTTRQNHHGLSPHFGYFCLDTATGELREGMTWEQLKEYMTVRSAKISSFDRFVIDYL